MERRTKRQVKQYLSWGALAVLVTVLAVMPLLTGGEPEETGPKASILSTQPEAEMPKTDTNRPAITATSCIVVVMIMPIFIK